MRVYPTFPNEIEDVHQYIEGAKKIWDAFTGNIKDKRDVKTKLEKFYSKHENR